METIYIDRKGASLHVASNRLMVKGADQSAIASYPLRILDRVVLLAQCYFDSHTLAKLVAANISVVNVNGRFDEQCYSVQGQLTGNHMRRLTAIKFITGQQALTLAERIVAIRIRQQVRLLRSIATRRMDILSPLRKAEALLGQVLYQMQSIPIQSPNSLMGYEGTASREYFGAYQSAFSSAYGFTSRKRRPPTDPVNATLSLAYTLLHHEATNALLSAGLDPAFGVLHSPAYGRQSASCDLSELGRARVERFVWSLFQNKSLTKKHFYTKQSAVLLNKEGKQVFYCAVHKQQRKWRRALRRYCRCVVKALEKYDEKAADY